MNIYALPNYYYDRVDMDINDIDGIGFSTLDEYLYRFPNQKRLVSGYIKRIERTIEVSELYDLFCDFDKIAYFDSETHQSRMELDPVYKLITERYVKNPIIWTTSTQRIQSHYFDSKYLKIGEFQKIARKNAHQYFKMQSTNNVINFSKIRTLGNVDKHNKYFTDRFLLEGVLKTFVEKFIGTGHTVVVYDRVIEIYVKSKHATLQIEFTKWSSKAFLIWGNGVNVRKKSESFNDIFVILKDEPKIWDFYLGLHTHNDGFIKKYVDRLAKLKSDHIHTVSIMVGNIKYTIKELYKESEDTYFTQDINAYAIHNGSFERIHIVKSGKILRIHRHINYNTPEEIKYCSYSITENDFSKISALLFDLGIINVSLGDVVDENFDYNLLATGAQKNFALSFMKVPTTEASKMFSDYERFAPEIHDKIAKNPNPKDTRIFKDYNEIPENTFFELTSYKRDRVRHISEKNRKQKSKYITVKLFLEEFKKELDYFC